ncbi:hypothetical protein FKO01_16145 [Mesorhizobium sp. B2-3-3]|nr:hypothetical protein FKO01_16145 [Mesorhizobium sp. B2-3-3]
MALPGAPVDQPEYVVRSPETARGGRHGFQLAGMAYFLAWSIEHTWRRHSNQARPAIGLGSCASREIRLW